MFTSFYHVEIRDEGTGKFTCEVTLNPAHAIYEGHFPGMPVTPGVCMLRIVRECASRIMNSTLRFQQINSCKFLSVVDPEVNGKLLFHLEFGDNGVLRASASAEGKAVLKLKARLINA